MSLLILLWFSHGIVIDIFRRSPDILDIDRVFASFNSKKTFQYHQWKTLKKITA